jgi:ribokinase
MSVYVAGRINIDIVIEIDGYMKRGSKYRGKVVEIDVGGTAANIATAIARIDKDINTKLLGAIGNDYKDLVFEKLGAEGIDLSYVKILNYETGKAYIFIDPEGEPTIVTIPGANDFYTEDLVPSIDNAKALVLGNTTVSAAKKLLNTVPQDAILFIDPHALWIDIESKVRELNNDCFYMPNEEEFKLYAFTDADDVDGLKRYAQRTKCSLIIKRGVKGVIAIHRGNVVKINAVPLKCLGMKILSTAGCGDVFTGIFVSTYMKMHDIVEALKYSTVAAALKATKRSSRDSPRVDELEMFVDYIIRRGLLKVDISTI